MSKHSLQLQTLSGPFLRKKKLSIWRETPASFFPSSFSQMQWFGKRKLHSLQHEHHFGRHATRQFQGNRYVRAQTEARKREYIKTKRGKNFHHVKFVLPAIHKPLNCAQRQSSLLTSQDLTILPL